MVHSLRDLSASLRPGTRDRPPTRSDQPVAEHSLVIPSRTSSLHSRITQPIPSQLPKATQRTPKTLTYAYLVSGVGREPSQWVKAPVPQQGKITHMKGAVGQFYLPEILGSSPRLESDNEIARVMHSAMRACFPHDVELCTGRSQPHCVHHTYVLQQDSSQTLYGIALKVWSRADEKRAQTIRELRKRTEPDFYESDNETYWIPYCLSFLSRYPLYDLLGDYLRGMWIHWNKATNLFHAEEVSRILSFPAPRLNDLVRIDMKDYALCYQFPSSPTGFQNFSMWPIFSCLSIPNVVGIIEAAISPTRRIILVSHYPAILTNVAETIRYFVRVYEWSGLYVPMVHARHITELVQEPGPYILGVTSECKTLFTAPSDALVVDLDRNFVLTSSPPNALKQSQRTKMITRLSQALNSDVTPSGVPQHLRSAYAGGKLIPAGQVLVMRGDVENVQDPEWWNQDNVMSVMDHVCDKLSRNNGIKAIFGGQQKKALMTKVSMRHLNEIVRERNQYSRSTYEAWQDYINLKGRMDTEVSKLNKRNNFLIEEAESWKQQLLKVQAMWEQLNKEAQDLKVKIETHKRENRRLVAAIEQQKNDNARLTTRLQKSEKLREEAIDALMLQQELAETLEREREKNLKELSQLKHHNKNITRQKEEAQRVVVHLRSLITGQTRHMEHIVGSIYRPPSPSPITETVSESPETEETSTEDADEAKSQVSERPHSRTSASSSYRLSTIKSSASLRRLSRRLDSNDKSIDSANRVIVSPSSAKIKRLSETSLLDIADRHLRDKTDAIANIIRNISDQCSAAVEALQLARDAEGLDMAAEAHPSATTSGSEQLESASDLGHDDESSVSMAHSNRSTIPPTPDLIRSSTALSMNSLSTTNDRSSQQYLTMSPRTQPKIVEGEDENESERGSTIGMTGLVKHVERDRPALAHSARAVSPVPRAGSA